MFRCMICPNQVLCFLLRMRKVLINSHLIRQALELMLIKKRRSIMMRRKRSTRLLMKNCYTMKWYKSKRTNRLNIRKSKKTKTQPSSMAKSRRWHLVKSRTATHLKFSILNINLKNLKTMKKFKAFINLVILTIIQLKMISNKKKLRKFNL